MSSVKPIRPPNWRGLVCLWIVGTALTWAIVPYAGLSLSQSLGELHVWSDVARVAGVLAANGLLLGLLSGAWQVAVLPATWGDRRRWFAGTVAGHVLGLPTAFLLAVFTLWAWAYPQMPTLLSANSSLTLYFPVMLSMLASGAIVALGQWLCFFRPRPAPLLLWAFGHTLAWAAGFIAANVDPVSGWPLVVRHGLAGAAIGLFSIGLLYFLSRASALPVVPQAAVQPA